MPARRVLVLGGTGEARELAGRLTQRRDVEVVSSLAGRVAAPRLPAGEVRVGGFGGASGMAQWLTSHAVDVVIDATHPFASTITEHAAEAAAQTHVALLRLHRPAWVAKEGDRWLPVASVGAAARRVAEVGTRALLATGRQDVPAFASVADVWFLIRCIDPPAGALPPRHEVLLARGPFDLAAERELLRRHGIDVVVTKNSGGAATRAKLDAARRLGLPVVIVERPALLPGVATVSSVDAAIAWLSQGQSG